MTIRVVQFTDTGEWYAGTRSKQEPFILPLDVWAAGIGQAHGRRVEGFEFDNPADDPRTGVLVEDVPLPVPDPEGEPLTAEENKQLRALLRAP